MQTRSNMAAKGFGAREDPTTAVLAGLPDIAAHAQQWISEIEDAYESNVSNFTEKLFKQATHLDLRFLMMRIDFGDFYSSRRDRSAKY